MQEHFAHTQNNMSEIEISELSFKDFLFRNRRNRRILWISAGLIVIQFVIYKFFYPYPNFIHGDSFSYIYSAYKNLNLNTYLPGYSNFIRLFSVFSSSDTMLVIFQYLFVQCSSIFFLSTLFYLFKPRKIVQSLLVIFFVCNPLLLGLANLISSDCYFLSISLVWWTLLLWIIQSPTLKLILLQSFVLYIAFTTRYNALIYPFIGIIVLFLSKAPLKRKLLGIGITFTLCTTFVIQTGYRYQALTGVWQYSPFSGWQMANNAMYAYRFVDNQQRKSIPDKFIALDNLIRTYFDSTRNPYKHIQEGFLASTAYMWDKDLPLIRYQEMMFVNDKSSSSLKKWACMGPFYKEYGETIIKLYPKYFINYYLWPNFNKFIAPSTEYLGTYNMGRDTVSSLAKDWFKYSSNKIHTRFKSSDITILDFYPILSGIVNMMILGGLIYFISLGGIRNNKIFSKGVLLAGVVWISNVFFTVIASSPALRFQAFPILITTTFSFLLCDWILHETSKREELNSRAKVISSTLQATSHTNIIL